MDDGCNGGGWRPIRDLISFFESASGGHWIQGGVCDNSLRASKAVLEETFPSVSAHGRRLLFEEKVRKFRSEILDAKVGSTQGSKDAVCAERSQRQRILQQRRDAGRNKTIVTSHISMLLRGRERDDSVLRPSMLDTKGGAVCLEKGTLTENERPGLDA
eukprot:jgi/Antlo1/1981/1621